MAADEAAGAIIATSTNQSVAQALAPWLQPGRFNADACVADLRRYVPLATLQSELNSYLATLKTKLVEVINEDYSDYVGLSGRLANVEGSVVRMRKPLLELRDKLHAVQEAVRTELQSLNQGLRKRKEVATQRALLELILEVSHVAAKVEKLLEEVAAADHGYSASTLAAGGADRNGGNGSSSGGELVAQCRLLERVAAEVSRLAFLANKGKDLAFVRSLEPRIAAHRSALRGRLSGALTAALAGRNTAAALHALHAAADLGEAGPAEAAVRTVVVAPLVDRLVGAHKAHGHPTVTVSALGSGAAGGGLAALLGSILAGVRAELGPLLDATLAPGSALRALDLLSNAVLDEVQGALAAALPGVFSPGVPPAFHANYLATLDWLRQLEAMCATRGAIERLRASAAHTSLMRRWNTSVYFSLLYQEIAGEFEDVLSAERLEPAPTPTAAGSGDAAAAAPPVQLAATSSLLRCLRRAASAEVVLPPLTDRFLRLALQLAQRYAAWVAAAAAARRDSASGASAGGAAPASPAPGTPGAAGMLGGSGGASGSPGLGAQAGAAAAGGCQAAWASSLPAEELTSLVHDTEAVHDALLGSLTASFLQLLPTRPPVSNGAPADTDVAPDASAAEEAMVAAVRGAVAEAAQAVRASGRAVTSVVTEEVVERCVTTVRQLKGITATYRMTSKGPPTRASHYVGSVLTPLRQLLESAQVRRLAPALQRELLVAPVAEGVCARYAALADELLISVRKTESSLKRLKKAKGGAGGEEDPTAAISDSDKITLQLHLDVAELGQQLARLLGGAEGGGSPAEELPSFRRLQEVVAPPPGFAAGAGSELL